MKRALRLYYLVKGKQEINIGDSIKNILDENNFKKGYDVLDWSLNCNRLEDLIDDIALTIRCKKMAKNSESVINSNLYLTTTTGIVLGIIPINHHNHDTYSKSRAFKKIPNEVRFDSEDDYLFFPKAKLLALIEKYNFNNNYGFEDGWLELSKAFVKVPSNDFVEGFKTGFNEALELFKELLNEK